MSVLGILIVAFILRLVRHVAVARMHAVVRQFEENDEAVRLPPSKLLQAAGS
jgi:hypothetical protein